MCVDAYAMASVCFEVVAEERHQNSTQQEFGPTIRPLPCLELPCQRPVHLFIPSSLAEAGTETFVETILREPPNLKHTLPAHLQDNFSPILHRISNSTQSRTCKKRQRDDDCGAPVNTAVGMDISIRLRWRSQFISPCLS
jgi:hypothetical protein